MNSKPTNVRHLRRSLTAGSLVLWAVGAARGADALPDAAKLPPPASRKIDYARDVAPVLADNCFRCHGPKRARNHLRLDSREAALRGGDDAPDIVSGESARSRLIFYVARLVEDKEMPPEGKGDHLTADQVSTLRAWIDQGAAYSASTNMVSDKFDFGWIVISNASNNKIDGSVLIRKNSDGKERGHELKKNKDKGASLFVPSNRDFAFVTPRLMRSPSFVATTWERE